MTPVLTDADFVRRLVVAASLGAVLGFERELSHKSAGLRTNTLIAVGSALFALISIELTAGTDADPTRVAGQIVTGIGFLGAGAIMRTDAGVQGLTTAATVWVNAALGVAVGCGLFHLAFIAAGITMIVLVAVGWVERTVERRFPNRPPDHKPFS